MNEEHLFFLDVVSTSYCLFYANVKMFLFPSS